MDQVRPVKQASKSPPVPGGGGTTFFTVQALRALAAVMVVVHHMLTVAAETSSHPKTTPWLGGSTGVDIFFVVSGLVMMTSAGGFPRKYSPTTFLVHRFERIAPPYWTLTTLKVLLLLAVPSISVAGLGSRWHVAASYLFLPASNGKDNFPVLVAGWTLSFELLFYCLFAAALALRVSLFKSLICAICLISAAALLVHPGGPPLLTLLNPIVLEFLYGVVLGQTILQGRSLRPSICVGLLVLGYASLLGCSSYQSTWMRPFSCGLPALAVVAGAVGLERFIGPRLPAWTTELGNSSYSLYLTHGLLIPLFIFALRNLDLATSFTTSIFVACTTLICVGVGELFYRSFELPIMRFFRKVRNHKASLVQATHDARASL